MGCLLAFLRVNASPVPKGFPLFPSPGAREGGSIGAAPRQACMQRTASGGSRTAYRPRRRPGSPIVEGSPIAHTIWCIKSIEVTHDCGLGCRACTVMIHKAQG